MAHMRLNEINLTPLGRRRTVGGATAAIACGVAAWACLPGGAALADATAAPAPYPNMAPIAQYQMASQADEIALARTAAPASISDGAEVLTLGAHGYETAAAGKNGFVCLVERAWASGLDDAEFWNPKERSPQCLNAAAARTVLPTYLTRTTWILAGASKAQIAARTKADIAAGRIKPPEVGSMCYMMSKDGYLNDAGGHWHPHVMFYLPHSAGGAAALGANLPGAPVMGGDVDPNDPAVVYFVVVAKWSDGTSGSSMAMQDAPSAAQPARP
jgi:hypothetical protein